MGYFPHSRPAWVLRVKNVIMAMNKADLADKVHDHLQGTKVQAEQTVQLIIDEIVNALQKGEEVSLAGLGIFTTKMRKARTARNPQTGDPIQVPAMRVPKFRPAKALKDAVKGS